MLVLGFGTMAGIPVAAEGAGVRASLPLVNPGQPIAPQAPLMASPATGFRTHFGAFGTFGHNGHFQRYPWWGFAGTGPIYYPSDYTPPVPPVESFPAPYPAYPPYENFSERSRPPVYYQPGCHTDTQTVPSEAGGERTITITRCY
jgi:hypothetical protein